MGKSLKPEAAGHMTSADNIKSRKKRMHTHVTLAYLHLACPSHIQLKTACLEDGAHNELYPSTSINNPEISPKTGTCQLDLDNSSVETFPT